MTTDELTALIENLLIETYGPRAMNVFLANKIVLQALMPFIQSNFGEDAEVIDFEAYRKKHERTDN